MYTYKIFHEYQIGDQSVYFKTNLTHSLLKDLLAALQFHFEEHIDEDDTLHERAATNIINELFAPIEYIGATDKAVSINTFWNREERCGEAYPLMKKFDNPRLIGRMVIEHSEEEARLKREIPELREESK